MGQTDHIDSWYAATANSNDRHPPLGGPARCDVLVVGGGFTGLSAALNLAERGFDVVLLEARRIGWGASGRNGGQISGGFNRTMAEIARLTGPDDARRLWELSEEAKAILRDRVARHAIDCDRRWGHLLAALKRRQLAELR
ncbi:MAG: FAD-binding oxidoreductase, partial [Inquilinus sp.]|nr:FAD-binding oxidoreductase [Inquilinus sp.]